MTETPLGQGDHGSEEKAGASGLSGFLSRIWSRIVHTARTARSWLSAMLHDGGGARQDLKQAFGHIQPRRVLLGLLILMITIYAASGVFTVQPGELAVVRSFGRITGGTVPEGIHYRLPWPMGKADKINVAEVRRETIGLEKAEPDHPDHPEGPAKIQVLSGDTNIIDYVVVVQYKIKDPADYLFNASATPYQVVRDAVRASVTKASAAFPVDDILTTKRQTMATEIKADVQAILDAYRSGILIVSVNFQKAYPPDEVADAFQDVQSAKEDKERMVNQAIGYQNSLLPEARGTAERNRIDAQAYSQAVVDGANGAAASFERILAQYRNDRRVYGEDVTRYRLYLEAMDKVIQRVKTYVVDKGGKIDLRLLESAQQLPQSTKVSP